MIFHLEVGTSYRIPTQEELDEVVVEFKKTLPVFKLPVVVHEFSQGALYERLIIQLSAQDWTPTETEVESIRKLFDEALTKEHSVVATRKGVKVMRSTFVPPEEIK